MSSSPAQSRAMPSHSPISICPDCIRGSCRGVAKSYDLFVAVCVDVRKKHPFASGGWPKQTVYADVWADDWIMALADMIFEEERLNSDKARHLASRARMPTRYADEKATRRRHVWDRHTPASRALFEAILQSLTSMPHVTFIHDGHSAPALVSSPAASALHDHRHGNHPESELVSVSRTFDASTMSNLASAAQWQGNPGTPFLTCVERTLKDEHCLMPIPKQPHPPARRAAINIPRQVATRYDLPLFPYYTTFLAFLPASSPVNASVRRVPRIEE